MKAGVALVALAVGIAGCVGDEGGYGYGPSYGPSYGYARGPYGPGYYGARPYYASSRPYYPNYGPQYGPTYAPSYGSGYGSGSPGFTLIASFPQGTVP